MYLDILLCEFLSDWGQLDTLEFQPKNQKLIMLDHLVDIDRSFRRSNSYDVGPFRIYAQEKDFDVRRIRTRLAGESFRYIDNGDLEVWIEHMNIPIGLRQHSHYGYYALVLPQKYSLVDLHVLNPNNPSQELRRRVIWYENEARHAVQVELSSRRHTSFSFRLHFKLKRSEYSDLFPNTDRKDTHALAELGREKSSSFPSSVDLSKDPESRAPSVFLCHSSTDKEFCRRLENDLTFEGIRVWMDEAEIKVGDSLIEKIESGIDRMDYLVAVLSARSVTSNWCKEELRQALASQITDSRVKVLPILLEECQIPGFLREKLYADFRGWGNEQEKYSTGFEQLLKRIQPTN